MPSARSLSSPTTGERPLANSSGAQLATTVLVTPARRAGGTHVASGGALGTTVLRTSIASGGGCRSSSSEAAPSTTGAVFRIFELNYFLRYINEGIEDEAKRRSTDLFDRSK